MLKMLKREKSQENGIIYTDYDCSDCAIEDNVRVTARFSYTSLNYDNEEQQFTDVYLNCSLRFALDKLCGLRINDGYTDLLSIIEPIKS